LAKIVAALMPIVNRRAIDEMTGQPSGESAAEINTAAQAAAMLYLNNGLTAPKEQGASNELLEGPTRVADYAIEGARCAYSNSARLYRSLEYDDNWAATQRAEFGNEHHQQLLDRYALVPTQPDSLMLRARLACRRALDYFGLSDTQMTIRSSYSDRVSDAIAGHHEPLATLSDFRRPVSMVYRPRGTQRIFRPLMLTCIFAISVVGLIALLLV